MADYRMYFLAADSIRAREDFKADSDTDAVLIARVLCDACSDSYDSFELWQAKRKVDTAQQRRPMSFAELAQAHQQIVLETEETLLNSGWAIARSERLIERIERLKSGGPK